MKITDRMVVADAVKDSEADVRPCPICKGPSFFVPQTVMVLSKGGARRMRLWSCETHPLPTTVTDSPDEV